MEAPRWHDDPHNCQAPSLPSNQDTHPASSSAHLTNEDIIGGAGIDGWRLDEVMDARSGSSCSACISGAASKLLPGRAAAVDSAQQDTGFCDVCRQAVAAAAAAQQEKTDR
jgi:hypothetical protein